jgi:NAD(P)-dependent dehydrogenase (short-subunit alcohol dehydrogenase family)
MSTLTAIVDEVQDLWPADSARRDTLGGLEGGAAGIRVNTVNPDAVLQGSKIWGGSWREERAAAYDLSPDELEDHYRQRNTLKVNILPRDIAEAVLHFASEARSGKSTGNLLNVDGGVPAAYAR